jgi:hypothetical protein
MPSRRKHKPTAGSPDFDANQVTKRDIEYEVTTAEAEEPEAPEGEGPARPEDEAPQGPDRPSAEPPVSEPGLERDRHGGGVRLGRSGDEDDPPHPDRHSYVEPTD